MKYGGLNMKFIETIHNATTNEITQIERVASAEEIELIKELEQREQTLKEAEAQAEAKRQTALAKLAALGLEEDDFKALGL